LTVDADGRIVVVGRATSSMILDMAVARYRADGTLDTGFGANGRITADFHVAFRRCRSEENDPRA
jgi:hypothetical protein